MSATTIIVNDESPRRQYTATAGQTLFDFPIPFFEQGDLTVYLTPAGQTANDVADLLTITTNYTVSGENTQDGGLVTLTSGATVGDIITIDRVLDLKRLADYQNAGDLLAETLNREQDSEIMISQQLRDDIDRSVKRSSSSTSTADLTLPEPGASKVIGWNPAANALENKTLVASFARVDEDRRYGPTFATVAAMTAANPVSIDGVVVDLVAGMSVKLQAFTYANDGGYGDYIVESGDTSDGGERLLAANGNTLVLQREEVLYLEQLGAVINTDVTPIVIKALATDAQKVSFRKSGQTYKGSTGTNALRDDFDFDLNGCTIDFVDFEHNTGRTSHYWLTNADSLLDRGGALSRQYRISSTTIKNVKVYNGICQLRRGSLIDFAATDFYFVSIDQGTNCHYKNIDVIDTMETDVLDSVNVNFSAVLQMSRCKQSSITMGSWVRANYCKTWECQGVLVAGNKGSLAVGTAIEDDYGQNGVFYRNTIGAIGEYAGSAFNSAMGVNGTGNTVSENIIYNGRISGLTLGHAEASRPYVDSPTLGSTGSTCKGNQLVFEAALTSLSLTSAGIRVQAGDGVNISNNIVTGLNLVSLTTVANMELDAVNTAIAIVIDNTGVDVFTDHTAVIENNTITECSKGFHFTRVRAARIGFNVIRATRSSGCFINSAVAGIDYPTFTFEGNTFDALTDSANTIYHNFIYAKEGNEVNVINGNKLKTAAQCIYTQKCYVKIENSEFDAITALPVGGTDQHSFTFKSNRYENSATTYLFDMSKSVGAPPENRTALIDIDHNIDNGSSTGGRIYGDSGATLIAIVDSNAPELTVATSGRPTLDVPRRFRIYDATIGKPIWWSGVDWRDALGTLV